MDAKNRWYVWQIVKSWDMPRNKVLGRLAAMNIPVHGEGNEAYIEKHVFRSWLWLVTDPNDPYNN